jgi:hypothetical protein
MQSDILFDVLKVLWYTWRENGWGHVTEDSIRAQEREQNMRLEKTAQRGTS